MLIYPDYDISQTIHLTRGKYILKYEWAGSKDPSHQVSAEVLWNGQKKTLIAKDQHIHHEEYEVFGEQGNNTLMFKGVGEYTVQLLHKAYTINNVQLVPIPLDYIKFKTTQGKDVSNKPHSQADGIIPIYPPRLEKTSATTILTSTNVPQLISTPANVIPSTTTASPITNHQDSHTLTVEDKINNVTPVQSKSSVKDSTQSINAPVTGISASVHTETPNP